MEVYLQCSNQLLSMRIGKINKMITAATMMTRNMMKMIHHHHHHETIIHTIQNEEPGDSDLHTYSDKNNISNDWRNKNNLLWPVNIYCILYCSMFLFFLKKKAIIRQCNITEDRLSHTTQSTASLSWSWDLLHKMKHFISCRWQTFKHFTSEDGILKKSKHVVIQYTLN